MTAVSGCTTPSVPGEVVLLEVEMPGPRVNNDDRLIAALAGGDAVAEIDALGASCHNAVRWLENKSLNPQLVVSTNPRLVRVAQLLEIGSVDPKLVSVVEPARFTAEDPTEIAVNEGFTSGDLLSYERLLDEPPSAAARDRFVVYVASETTRRQVIVFLDVSKLEISSPASLGGRLNSIDPIIAGHGELSFDADDCSSFAAIGDGN